MSKGDHELDLLGNGGRSGSGGKEDGGEEDGGGELRSVVHRCLHLDRDPWGQGPKGCAGRGPA